MNNMLKINQVYKENCIGENGMCLIDDKSIDCIICDLPFGTTKNKWDSIIDLNLLWEQYEKIIKDNGCIALFAQTPFDKILGASNLKLLKYEWVWEKEQGTGHLNAKKMPLKIHENILIFYKKLPIYNPQMTQGHTPSAKNGSHKKEQTNYGKFNHVSTGGSTTRYPKSIIKFNRVYSHNLIHPTQKPVELIEYLIRTYTNENDLILDNCMGSFTTAVACINTNRNYIGFENNDKYFELGQKRLEELKLNGLNK